jgi:hypothetical protein
LLEGVEVNLLEGASSLPGPFFGSRETLSTTVTHILFIASVSHTVESW